MTLARAGLACLLGLILVGAAAPEDEAQRMDANSEPAADEELAVVATRPSERSLLSFEMDAETLSGIPGVNDDPLSALITLPGVAVNDDFEGGTAIRGTRPLDNTYRIDFMEVGYLFHFGTGSVVDGDLVDGFTFYPAGYGARYQGVIGGVVDARTRDPLKDGFRAVLDANLIQGGVLVEGALSDESRAYFSTRASYYDLVLQPFLDEINDSEADDVDVVQLPRFYDYRGRMQFDLRGGARLDLLVDSAADEAELLFHDESTETLQDPALAGAHRFALDYDRQGIVYSRPGGEDDWRWQAGWARNRTGFSARLGGAGTAETMVSDHTIRLEATAPVRRRQRLGWGITLSHLGIDYDVLLRDTGCTEFEVRCRFSDAEPIATTDELHLVRIRAFVENTVYLTGAGDGLNLVVGLGHAQDDYLSERELEPRARLEWHLGPRSSLTLGAGRYYQLPAFEYIEDKLGNRDLSYLEADHYVLAFKHRFANGWLVRTDVYRKDLGNLVTANAASRYDNRGGGTGRGFELLLQGALGPRWFGWAALSYSRAVREDTDTGERFDFEYDQPLIASVVAKFLLNEQVSFSAKLWYHSGPPETPILGGEADPDNAGAYLPVYGEVNGERLPSYFRLDLRADFKPRRWQGLSFYGEILNATNHRNVSGYEYEYDYSSRRSITQVPLFLSVGVRKEILR